MGEQKRITFRIDGEKIEQLDDLIILAKAHGNLERDVSRSDLLRQSVDDLIEQLEESTEGNSNTPLVTAN